MLQKTPLSPPGVEDSIYSSRIVPSVERHVDLFYRCVDEFAAIIDVGIPFSEIQLAHKLGYQSAESVSYVWRGNPELWRMMCRYRALMSTRYAKKVRKHVEKNGHRLRRRDLTEDEVRNVAASLRERRLPVDHVFLGFGLMTRSNTVWHFLRYRDELKKEIGYTPRPPLRSAA